MIWKYLFSHWSIQFFPPCTWNKFQRMGQDWHEPQRSFLKIQISWIISNFRPLNLCLFFDLLLHKELKVQDSNISPLHFHLSQVTSMLKKKMLRGLRFGSLLMVNDKPAQLFFRIYVPKIGGWDNTWSRRRKSLR